MYYFWLFELMDELRYIYVYEIVLWMGTWMMIDPEWSPGSATSICLGHLSLHH